jgi:hypothetical protein
VTSQAWPCTAVPVRADSRAAAAAQRSGDRLASTTVVPADTAGLGWPMNNTAPQWYRLRRPA